MVSFVPRARDVLHGTVSLHREAVDDQKLFHNTGQQSPGPTMNRWRTCLTLVAGFLPPDDTSHSSDKKDINNVDSLVLMRDNFSMGTSYGVGPLPHLFLEASDSVILKEAFGQISQSLRRTWWGERR